MSDLSLRGKCKEYAEAACQSDSTLTLVRGWYHDPTWGSQEHWWTTRPDGSIVDPTSSQFPFGGIADWYEEFVGTYPCRGCNIDTDVSDLTPEGFCSYDCYGRTVGLL